MFNFCQVLVLVALSARTSHSSSESITNDADSRHKRLVKALFAPDHWNIQSTFVFEDVTSRVKQPESSSVGSFTVLCSDTLEAGKVIASTKVQRETTVAPNTLVSVPESMFQIYAVLRAENTICLTPSSNVRAGASFTNISASFQFVVPAPLKVHKSVHAYLLRSNAVAADDDFIATARLNRTAVTSDTATTDDDFIAASRLNRTAVASDAATTDDDFIAASRLKYRSVAPSNADDDFIGLRNSSRPLHPYHTRSKPKQHVASKFSTDETLPDYLSVIHDSHSAVMEAISSFTQHAIQNSHHLDTFFWTRSPRGIFAHRSTHTRFLRGSYNEGFEQDRLTLHAWHHAARDLHSASFMNHSDTCHFSSLPIKHVKTKSLLDVKSLLSQPTGRTCIAHLVAALAQLPSVRMLSLVNKPKLLNYRSRSIQQSATVGVDLSFSPYTFAGLMGNGQLVSVADTGVDDTSCYFSDTVNGQVPRSDSASPVAYPNQRVVVQYAVFAGGGDDNDTPSGHGSFVCGTASGSLDTSDIYSSLLDTGGRYDGVAPGAQLAFLDLSSDGVSISPPDTAAELFYPGYSAGAKVHSNSWGAEAVPYYSNNDLDDYLYNNMDFLAVYAAGNSGSNGVTVEASAKNTLAVGSGGSTYMSASINYVAAYSSYGTTYDVRLKPDIISPGDSIRSVLSGDPSSPNCALTGSTGTSMAAPGAAGIAILIRQYFVDNEGVYWSAVCNLNYAFCSGFEPSGVLVKAVLLHSGSAMLDVNVNSGQQPIAAPPGPVQGYGRVTLSNVLPLMIGSMDLFVDDLNSVSDGSSNSYAVTVNDSTVPLKVTLSWFDPPAQDGTTSSALINDLDLLITDPSGNQYYGNGGSSPDTVNNNEQILQSSPMTGVWTVSVQGSCVPYQGSQQYSLVITSGGFVE